MDKKTVKLALGKTMREIVLFIQENGLSKNDIIQVVFGDGNWYLLYQK